MAEQINSVQEIVERLGGPTKLSQKLGISQPTVSIWIMRNKIPSRWFLAIMALLNKEGCTAVPKIFGMKPARD